MSHNYFDALPQPINRLINLELLDVSYNRLRQIKEIVLMPKLRIFNICGNVELTHLPKELSTCDSLVDLVLDTEYIVYPSAKVIESGTAEILKYLLMHNDSDEAVDVLQLQKPKTTLQNMKRITANLLEIERGKDVAQEITNANDDKLTREKKFMEHERFELEKYSNLEAALHQQQQKRKQDLLQHILKQQNESDSLIQKMQKVKDSERIKLIDDILEGKTFQLIQHTFHLNISNFFFFQRNKMLA